MISIILTGVGGQDVQLACDILGRAAVAAGADTKTFEDRGPMQHGGSLVYHVRFGEAGEDVRSPAVSRGGADVLVAFEELEGLRCASYLREGTGRAYINRLQLRPPAVSAGCAEYPEDLEEKIRAQIPRCLFLDGQMLAVQAHAPRAVSAVLIGALAVDLPLPGDVWMDAVADSVRPAFQSVSQAAFLLGHAAAKAAEAVI